jgi:hypothetical protein
MRKPFEAPAITDEASLVEGTLVSGDAGGDPGGDPGQPE